MIYNINIRVMASALATIKEEIQKCKKADNTLELNL